MSNNGKSDGTQSELKNKTVIDRTRWRLQWLKEGDEMLKHFVYLPESKKKEKFQGNRGKQRSSQ